MTSFGPLKISIFHEWIDETAKIGHLSTSLPLKISIFHEWIDEAAGGRVIVGVAQDLDDAGMLQSGELPHLIVELQLGSLTSEDAFCDVGRCPDCVDLQAERE